MATSTQTELELLRYSYWEHFKYAKDLALVLPHDHPKRVLVEQETNRMALRIQVLTGKTPG